MHVVLFTAGATPIGQDLSMFYGDQVALTTISERQRFLDAAIYGALVRDAVVCCVDVVLVRSNDGTTTQKECLLVERSSEPVKGVWWWPGGRLLKGKHETTKLACECNQHKWLSF